MTYSAGEAFRYAQATFASAGCSLLLPAVLHSVLAMSPQVAVAIGLAVAFLLNFAIARYYVFRSPGSAGPEIVRFALVSMAFRVAEYLAFLLLLVGFGIHYMVALFLVLCVSVAGKFLVQRHFVFRTGAAK